MSLVDAAKQLLLRPTEDEAAIEALAGNEWCAVHQTWFETDRGCEPCYVDRNTSASTEFVDWATDRSDWDT